MMAAQEKATDLNGPSGLSGEDEVVLVVDDSKLQRKILVTMIARWGYTVLEAASGAEALDICAEHKPSIVLSDWMMPGMSGLEFCQAFKSVMTEGYGYFILLTSKSDKAEIAQGLDSGADDFLSKPVDGHELRARIMAGKRIVAMQRELTFKNRMISETLEELQGLYNSLDSDLLEAKKLQQSLLRERYCALDAGDLSLLLRSSGHVGGDLVGHFSVGPDHLGLFAIDVSGHGISSALMTARLAGYLSASALDQNIALERDSRGGFRPRPPAEAIKALNEMVLSEMDTEHYFTMLLAHIDLVTGQVVMGQAGHPHPVVQRACGLIDQVGAGGFPVGLMPGVSFTQFETSLAPGDRLIVLSDGVTECPVSDGGFVGEEGLADILPDLETSVGPAFFEALVWRLAEISGLNEFPDDVSGIVFEYRGAAQP